VEKSTENAKELGLKSEVATEQRDGKYPQKETGF
jgi:hypothetical protein